MHLIQDLLPHSRVLDMGASAGSFAANRSDVTVVRLDLEKPHAMGAGWYVWGDAARMPFATHCFDLICSNHSLEHFHELEAAVREAGRRRGLDVVRPAGGSGGAGGTDGGGEAPPHKKAVQLAFVLELAQLRRASAAADCVVRVWQ